VKACSPGNGTIEIFFEKKLLGQNAQNHEGPNLPTEMAKWLETNYYQTYLNTRYYYGISIT